ncbi:hypothetical protein M9Y10_022899 [Tritrichomonas musculus]|uniref:Uncharacterized protein n=1 Tax=Tritrichomonas musculus TaxID=1915356 RepID=A0ABR2KTL8_9EUKA
MQDLSGTPLMNGDNYEDLTASKVASPLDPSYLLSDQPTETSTLTRQVSNYQQGASYYQQPSNFLEPGCSSN